MKLANLQFCIFDLELTHDWKITDGLLWNLLSFPKSGSIEQ